MCCKLIKAVHLELQPCADHCRKEEKLLHGFEKEESCSQPISMRAFSFYNYVSNLPEFQVYKYSILLMMAKLKRPTAEINKP